jgi:hypothetical protein
MGTWPGLAPLYQSTQLQLGLKFNRGIPSLVVSHAEMLKQRGATHQ